MKKIILFLFLVSIACNKQATTTKSTANSATNQIMAESATINSVCGDINTWYVSVTIVNPKDSGKYWVVYCSDSIGHVTSYKRISDTSAGAHIWEVSHGDCPYIGNCGFDISPILYVYRGPKPVVGEVLGATKGVKLAQWKCPQCSTCN